MQAAGVDEPNTPLGIEELELHVRVRLVVGGVCLSDVGADGAEHAAGCRLATAQGLGHRAGREGESALPIAPSDSS